jgi:hypothetical protein
MPTRPLSLGGRLINSMGYRGENPMHDWAITAGCIFTRATAKVGSPDQWFMTRGPRR